MSESVDDEDEVILALAQQLGELLPLIGGPEYATVLLPPLEALAGVEEATVRNAVRRPRPSDAKQNDDAPPMMID